LQYGIAVADDGAVWTTLVHTGEVARLTSDGQVRRHPVGPQSCKPSILIRGVDGAMWSSRNGAGQVGRMDVDFAVTEFPLPDRAAKPHGIAVDGRGAAWVAMESGSVVRIEDGGR
jgi:virginiamycin B lyase